MNSIAIVLLSFLLHSTMLLSTVKSFAFQSVQLRKLALVQRGGSCAGGSFCTPAVSHRRRQQQTPHSRTRHWLSSAPTEGETSVVDTCREKIATALETDDVKVIGAYDDPNGSHISIEVTSSLFEGKRPVQRQQLVYKALWEELQGAVHAVDSMVCQTPTEKK